MLIRVFLRYNNQEQFISKPACVLSSDNRRAMEGVVEAPSLTDIAMWPIEAGARVLGRNVLPTIFSIGELVNDTIARAGSAMIELAKRPTV